MSTLWAQRGRSSSLQSRASWAMFAENTGLVEQASGPHGLTARMQPSEATGGNPPGNSRGSSTPPPTHTGVRVHTHTLPMSCPQAVQHGCSEIPAGRWPLLSRWLRRVMIVTQASHLGVLSQGKKSTQGGALHFQGAQRCTGVHASPSCPHTWGRGSGGRLGEPRNLAEELMPSWPLPARPFCSTTPLCSPGKQVVIPGCSVWGRLLWDRQKRGVAPPTRPQSGAGVGGASPWEADALP